MKGKRVEDSVSFVMLGPTYSSPTILQEEHKATRGAYAENHRKIYCKYGGFFCFEPAFFEGLQAYINQQLEGIDLKELLRASNELVKTIDPATYDTITNLGRHDEASKPVIIAPPAPPRDSSEDDEPKLKIKKQDKKTEKKSKRNRSEETTDEEDYTQGTSKDKRKEKLQKGRLGHTTDGDNDGETKKKKLLVMSLDDDSE